MPKSNETQKPAFHDGYHSTLRRSVALDLLEKVETIEGFTLEWMLSRAKPNGGRA